MKRLRFLALALMILLCSTLLHGASASTIILTAANDGFFPLSASTMPVRRSGEWYVPYTAFGSFAISATLQENGDILVMQSESTTLTFSLPDGYVYDHAMNSFSQPAYALNSTVYVPVKLVCGLFGLSFSMTSGDYQVLRIFDDNAALSDHVFIAQMAADAQRMINQYKGTSPARPTPPVDLSPEPVPPEEPIQPARIRPHLIYLTFAGAPTEYSADLLGTLSAYDRKATFFLPLGEAWDVDFVRRAAAEGHALGLLAAPDGAQTERLTAFNDLLFDLTGLTTRLLAISGGSDLLSAAQQDAIIAGGYRLWDATVTADDETRRASEVARLMLRSFDGTTATTVLGMHHTRSTNAALTLILRDLRVNRVTTASILISDVPINRAGEQR